jgi:phosphohistidine phosphatase
VPVVKRIYLLRHAKSDWGDESLPDHDRPLNKRGRRSAAEIPETLARKGISPDRVLASTARRARETAEPLSSGLDLRATEELYGATAGTLLGQLQAQPDDVGSVLLVGHNPGMEELAGLLARTADATKVDGGMRTATLIAFEADVASWSELAPGAATVTGRWEHPGEKG